MTRDKAIGAAVRAANAAFRTFGGPRAFSWLQCLDAACDHGGGSALAAIIDANPQIEPAALYRRAVASDAQAKPFAATPLALQVAIGVFLVVWLHLRERVTAAEADERVAQQRPRLALVR